MPLTLPQVTVQQEQVTLHNHYEIPKYFQRESAGRLINRYRQRMVYVTEDFIVGFHAALQDEVGDAAGEIMYRCGYEWGQRDMASFEQRFKEEFGTAMLEMPFGMVLETWWWPLQAAGWGAWSYDLTHRQEGLIFVDLYDSVVAKSVGVIGKVACHYYAGLFAAVFGYLARRELSSIEIQCYSLGEDFCKFLVGSGKRINAAQFWVREGASASEVIARL